MFRNINTLATCLCALYSGLHIYHRINVIWVEFTCAIELMGGVIDGTRVDRCGDGQAVF